ncbi:MAG: SDR family NAD(P)-dependent oxidoreductase [Bacteroidetes bacterium]|nr:MAG: SDR family NAD(P)-dependent oxidoreductase [Bacteroidota bacterium]
MASIFITGSSDGLGLLVAKALIARGHQVVLHARNEKRARDTWNSIPRAAAVVTGDLNDMDQTKALAAKVNAWGSFDVVIHNAGVYHASGADIFRVNTLAPYVLTCLIEKPKRLIYLSSGMQAGGQPKLDCFLSDINRITYSDSKLHVIMLCKAVARKWPEVYANAVNPGWVPTRMGGAGAPDSLESGYETQLWLAVSQDERAKVSGRYFFHQKEIRPRPEADDVQLQEQLMDLCGQLTGVSFPERKG